MKHRTLTTVLLPFAGAVLALAGLLLLNAGCAGRGRSSSKAMRGYVQGVQAYHAGDHAGAVAALEAATKQDPELIMAQSMLGDLYRTRGDYRAASERYETLTKLDPYSATNHYRLGVAYHLLNRMRDAAAAYVRAIKLDPRDARSSTNLGLAYLALGQPEDALRYTERATLLDPRSAAAWTNLGVALEATGDLARAESAYRRSLDLDSTQVQPMLNLGLNLIQQNKTADAVSVMEQVLKLQDAPTIRKRYGDALARAGRYDEAVEQYDVALAQEPDNYDAVNGLAYVRIAEYRKGLELDDSKRQAALELWRKSLSMNPDQPRIQAAVSDWSEKGLFGK